MWTGLDPPSVAGMPSSPSPTRLIVALLAAGVLSLGATPAPASTVTCGATITTDTTLHHDLTDCAGNGLVIGADNIRLNLNGHTVDGNDAEDVCPGEVIYCDDGINNAAGHTGITIKGGTIHRFDIGVVAVDADDNVLRELTTSHNAVGIQLNHSAAGRIANNSVTDNFFHGVLLLNSSDRNRVETNVLSGNESGISLWHSDHNDVRNNVVSHSFESAIGVDNGSVGNSLRANLLTDNADSITMGEARDTRISRNIVRRSGSFGSPDTGGFGILVSGSDDSTVDRNVVVGGRGPAIFVTSLDTPEISDRNVISRNVANSTLYDGILVDADATATLIQRNSADRSGDDGIEVDAKGTTLSRNTANRNHDLGIEAVPGVIDGGGNHAFGNGNPAQCVNIACGWMR
jgi:parallel beta-helix repeat protein